MRKEKLEELHHLLNLYKTVKKSEVEIVKGDFLQVGCTTYALNNGRTFKREEIIKNKGHSSAVIILPVTTTGEVILTVQPRVLTARGVGIELPAGYIEPGQTGDDAAYAELRQETGYDSKLLVRLGGYYQDQGCSRAFNESFLAIDCVNKGTQELDADEFITTFKCTYDEMLELVDMEYIQDAGSIITIQKSKKLLR